MKKQNKKVKLLSYYNELHDENGYIYSIDKLRIEFSLDKQYAQSFADYMGQITRIEIHKHHDNYEWFKYRNFWTIKYDAGVSMTIACGLNGKDVTSDVLTGYIEVDPNKAGHYEQFWVDYKTIKSFCKYFNLKRCDIALDIPVKRKYLILEKNNRKYNQEFHSHDNKTEYLGKRSHIGYVKLYNKTMESKLDYDLSRLEITCLLSSESYKQYFPAVYDISRRNKLSDELEELTDTERGIVEMASILTRNGDDAGLMIFNSMGRYMKEKLKKFILPEQCMITYSAQTINRLITDAISLYL